MPTQPTPATDSAAELHKLIGNDATATFENDPTFVESNPTNSASSENLNEQRPGAGEEFQAAAAKSTKGAGPDPDEPEDDLVDDEDDDLEDDEDDDLDDEEDEDDDLEDDDEDDVDEDDDDDEYEDDDEDDDEEDEEDDADEVKASASPSGETLWADGLLGYEEKPTMQRRA